LQQWLGQSLPDYMVPSVFMLLEALPLTPNGKVDRKALPEPDMSSLQAVYVAPRTEIEQKVCEIWQEVLGLEQVGITDNFFQLGGDSLLAVRLVNELSRQFKLALPLNIVFNQNPIDAISAYINNAGQIECYKDELIFDLNDEDSKELMEI
jgi:acyl carrier protein